MPSLHIRLAGPLQSWGVGDRFTARKTRSEPSKSGVLGLLAAADGRRRTDPIEDLLRLSFGVRIDQPGQLLRDFQTARSLDGTKVMPLVTRYYLTDAIFVAAVSCDDATLLEHLNRRLREPRLPLYLGRRSCAPTGPLDLGVVETELAEALREAEWQATERHRREQGRMVDLPIYVDAVATGTEKVSRRHQSQDVPLSFDPVRREYAVREVAELRPVTKNNELGRREPDFMAALGGA